ncbi:FKBP-type peptidyl-prolyl cis-trans isomerase [Sphingomonas parva]|uniref:Peptidyl-prolyl cis-trans isomerase n=1 Tax=Sphingomonas parva TaxID=2555898 RepID=A0A4Y8ZSA6_9SPHN|nr:FKBP-type peptidyl-prolyl cis-trans isomerase [Sphingomonas parva]TFI58901.1 FKBP-type peptidyl-prolyl cis-trans isomerase [Sphingomonas parva]
MSVTAVPLRPIRKGSVLKLWLGLILLALLAAGVAWAGTAGQIMERTTSGLQYRVLEEGEGPSPTASDVAFITYTGRLADGTVFDSNEGGQPLPMPLAEGAAIKGFTEGLLMMKKGAKYQLRIPPELGYGAEAKGPIPANSTLDFDVTLVDFMPEATLRQMMMQQQMMQMQGGGGAEGGPPPQGGGQ